MSLDETLPRWPVTPDTVLVLTSEDVRRRLDAYAQSAYLDPTTVVMLAVDATAADGLSQLFDIAPDDVQQVRRRPSKRRGRRRTPLVLWLRNQLPHLRRLAYVTGATSVDQFLDRVLDRYLPRCV